MSKCVNETTCTIFGTYDVSNAKFWHAHFEQLTYRIFFHMHKSDMILSFGQPQSAYKNVCEGC